MRNKEKYYKYRKGEPFYYPLLILTCTAFYPMERHFDKANTFLNILYVSFALYSYAIIQTVLHVFFVLKDNLDVSLDMDIFVLICGLTVGMDQYRFSVNSKCWSDVMKQIVDTKKFGYPRDFPIVVKQMEKYSVWSLFYTCFSAVLYVINAALQAAPCRKLNKTKGLHEVCGSIMPTWLPEEYSENKHLIQVVSFYLMFCVLCLIVGCLMVCMIVLECSSLLRAKFQHLNDLLEEVFDGKNDYEKLKRFDFCVRYHLDIIRTAENFGKVLTITMGHASLTTATIIAFSVHSVLKGTSFTLAFLVFGYLGATFILCHCGQMICDKSYLVADGIYSSKWYFQKAKLMKLCNLVIMRCRKPVLIKTFPFNHQTHALFLNLLQGGYSYVTLLSTKK